MTTRRILSGLCAVLLSCSFAGAANAKPCKSGNTGKVLGGILGGIAGGVLGNKTDGGEKRGFGTVVGALAGALAGSQLGKMLDKCEQEEVNRATMASLDSDEVGSKSRRTWQSPSRSNVNGAVQVRSAKRENGVACKTTDVFATDPASGAEVVQPVKYCRTAANGGWAAVTA